MIIRYVSNFCYSCVCMCVCVCVCTCMHCARVCLCTYSYIDYDAFVTYLGKFLFVCFRFQTLVNYAMF